MQKIVIIGNGIAGITAARHIRKLSDHHITVISGETDHFFSRTALMYIYMGHMTYEHTKPYEDWFWDKNKINLKRVWVKSIDFTQKEIKFENGNSQEYDKLILATGSQSNKFGWPGQDLEGVQGLYSYQDLELMEKNTHNIDRAVILGGGLIGVEMAEMLHSRHIPVTYLIREKHFWDNMLPKEEATLIDGHLYKHGIDLRQETELEEILDDGNGKVKAIKTKSGDVIECQFVGLTVGVHPNIDLVKESKVETDRGILVDEYLQTNIPDVYAIGDCAQLRNPPNHRRAIEAVWYAGRMMGETVARTVADKKTEYKPGIWFNSAKFFDIEYQNYGTVLPKCPDDSSSFYWECDDHEKCMKIIYKKDSLEVQGVNLFGIRNRHEVWDKWLNEKRPLEYIIANLPKANFDPEFYKHWEGEIQEQFNEEFPDKSVGVRKKGFLEKIFG
ncbi:NAD(P)/FAD-dependent oxidoreductase [Ekhidna sp.]|uniref:NAD(P)/FAD-dependent oxidoreductase n=1 Tax=Ekhidna sp. TaxID=2608089 RepID=UPI003B503DE2